MNRYGFSFLCIFALLSGKLISSEGECPSTLQVMRNVMKNLIVDNQKFCEDPAHDEDFYKHMSSVQHPKPFFNTIGDLHLAQWQAFYLASSPK